MILPAYNFDRMLSFLIQRKAERQLVSKKYFSVNSVSLIVVIRSEHYIISKSVKQQLLDLSL